MKTPKYTGIWCGHACQFLDPTEEEQDRMQSRTTARAVTRIRVFTVLIDA
jgi:hypothetical protein